MTDEDQIRRQNTEVIEAFFGLRSADPNYAARRLELWHDDGVKQVPFALTGMGQRTEWAGKQQLVENLARNHGRFSGSGQVDLHVYPTTDPDLFFVTSRTADDSALRGRPYRQEYVHMVRLKDRKVILQREYFNPLALLDALGGKTEYPTPSIFADPDNATPAQ